jgi:hypothetical protein
MRAISRLADRARPDMVQWRHGSSKWSIRRRAGCPLSDPPEASTDGPRSSLPWPAAPRRPWPKLRRWPKLSP